MLDSLLVSTALAAVGATLAWPVSRRLMLGDIKRDWLVDELEFDHILEDGQTARLKDGAYIRLFTVSGLPFETKPLLEQERLLDARADLFHQVGQTGTTWRLYGIKRQRDVSFEANWPSPALQEIGETEQQTYRHSYRLTWLIILQHSDLPALAKATSRVSTLLRDYRIEAVKTTENKDEPCPITSFLSYLVTGELRFDRPAIHRSLSGNLPACDLTFDRTGALYTQTPEAHISRVIAITSWPEHLQGLILTELLSVPGDIEISQIARPLSNERTLAGLMRKQQEFSAALIGNSQAAEETVVVTELLGSNSATLYQTQFQLTVRARDEEALEALLHRLSETLARRRVVYSVETATAALCWANRLPGNDRLIRPLRLLDRNLAGLWCFYYSPEGMTASPFGNQPVRLFQTPSGQSYAFQFHASDKAQSAGNAIVIGGTGAGKSTLALHLLGGLAKFPDLRAYVFDSKEGARFMIEAMGGIYQSFDEMALNPLDVSEDNKAMRHRLSLIMRAMMGTTITEEMEAEIAHALDIAFAVEVPDRRFDAIYDLGFARGSDARQAFSRWVTDPKGREGLYAHIFNAPQDSLRSWLTGSHLVGINMNEALSDPQLGAPVVAHMAAAITDVARTGSGQFAIFVDEAAHLLQNAGFKDIVLQMYREYRKLGGMVCLAFQDPAALMNFPEHEGIINNTQTLIFFPNSLVRSGDLEAFNLNEEQINFITGRERFGEGRQVLVVKRDGTTGYDESVILDVDLGWLGDGLRYYRAGAAANRHLQQLKDRWGAEWSSHL